MPFIRLPPAVYCFTSWTLIKDKGEDFKYVSLLNETLPFRQFDLISEYLLDV